MKPNKTVQRDEDEAFMVAPDMLYKYYVFTALYYDALPALRGRKLGEGLEDYEPEVPIRYPLMRIENAEEYKPCE